MAIPKTTVLLERTLHQKLKAKIRNIETVSTVISRLVEMYLNGEIKLVIPEKQI